MVTIAIDWNVRPLSEFAEKRRYYCSVDERLTNLVVDGQAVARDLKELADANAEWISWRAVQDEEVKREIVPYRSVS